MPGILGAFALTLAPLRADSGDIESAHDYPGFTRPPGFVISGFDEDNPAEFSFPVARPRPDDSAHVESVPVQGHRYVITYELASNARALSLFQTQQYYEKLASDGGYTVEKSGAVGDVTETFHKVTGDHQIWVYLAPAVTANVVTVVEGAAAPVTPAPDRLVVNTATLPPPPVPAPPIPIKATTPPAPTPAPTPAPPFPIQTVVAPPPTPAPSIAVKSTATMPAPTPAVVATAPAPVPSASVPPASAPGSVIDSIDKNPPPDTAPETPVSDDPNGEALFADLTDKGRVVIPFVFRPGKDDLDSASQPLVDRIVAMMKNHPELFLRIEGHTDNSGYPEDNLRLSAQRAFAVQAKLVAARVDKKRLDYVGVGGLQPIASNITADGREKNRRIELVLWKKSPAFHAPAPNGNNYYPGGTPAPSRAGL